MADSSDSPPGGSAAGDSSSPPSPQWCVKQWAVLCEVLDVSDPTAVVPRVQALQNAGNEAADSPPSDAAESASPDTDALLNQLDASTAAEARERVRSLINQMNRLYREKQTLTDAGLAGAEEAVDEIERLKKQCDRLDEVASSTSALSADSDDASAERLAAIQNVLGISSVEEAKDLAAVAENMGEQLEALYDDRAQLQEVGVSSVESAVDMIQSLSAQLDELYEEQELLHGRPTPDESNQQDTFEQLAALYAEQEKLERALGVSEADAIIEMVEGLKDQIEASYSEQDEPAASDSEPTAGSVSAPSAPNGTPSEPNGAIPLQQLKQTSVFTSMRDQLESLYEEKEALLNMGIDDIRTAAGRIDELEARLSTLQHGHEQCRDRLEYLRRELGTADVEEIVNMVPSPSIPDAPSPAAARPKSDGALDSAAEETPVVFPEDTLGDIDDLPDDDLDALSVGVLRLDDDGAINYLNEAARQLPGLDPEVPRTELHDAFFFRTVPSASNTLFLNRFRAGVEQGQLDARFPYTFVSPQHPPTAFYVHLYRSGPSGANWILFRPVR